MDTGHGTGALTAVVRAERGGKILSLRDGAGTEWLTQSRRSQSPPPGTAFGDAEMAGWDECAPTIDRCVVHGAVIPDHGDAWDAVWTGTGATLRHVGSSLPYRIERTLAATQDGGLRLSYRATADHGSVPFFWAAHPQFAAPPGTCVEVAPAPRLVVDVLADGWPTARWSEGLAGIDGVAPGGCRKLYVHPDERVASVDLVRRDGSRLRMTFSRSIPYVGLWFDQGRYARAPVIAIEPAMAYADSLARAVELGTAPVLTPDRALEWWIELHAYPGPA